MVSSAKAKKVELGTSNLNDEMAPQGLRIYV